MERALDRFRIPAACALIVLAVAALYGRTYFHEFVSIDVSEYLLENPHVQQGLTWKGFLWAWTAGYASNWHPLTWISHMVDVDLFGFDPRWHNLENVAWHAANSVLVFLLFLRWSGFAGRSLFVALCFALHPQHVESVAWIAERKDVLSGFFGIATLLAWDGWARRGSRAAYGAALALYALGLCAKPMLVTWPFVLLLLDAWPYRRQARGWGRLVAEKLPFLGLAAGSAVVTWWAQSRSGAMQPFDLIPIEWRIPNAILAYGKYVLHTVWPVDLIVYYPHPGPNILYRDVALSAVVCVGALAAAFALRKRWPWAWVGVCFYFGTLVPVIGIVQVGGQAMADRYSYLPLLGVFLVVTWACAEAAARAPMAAGLLRPVAVLLVVAQFALAWTQVGHWKNSRTLGEEVVRVAPESSWGWNLIARDLLDEAMETPDRARALEIQRAAAARLARSVEVAPGDPHAWHMLGKALFLTGDFAGAEQAFRRGFELSPRNPAILNHLGELLLNQNRFDEAEPYLRRAQEIDDLYAGVHGNLGRLLLARGDFEGAEHEFVRAIELLPSFTPPRMQLARLRMRRGDHEGALQQIDAVLQRFPDDMEALRGRARALMELGREREALETLEAIVGRFGAYLPAHGDLAWLLATARDPAVRDIPRATAIAERAIAAPGGGRAPGLLDVVALCYGLTGRFDQAIAAASSAAERARELGDAELARRIDLRLQAYREGRADLSVPR
jgi:Flp pilus assembly protein TadD